VAFLLSFVLLSYDKKKQLYDFHVMCYVHSTGSSARVFGALQTALYRCCEVNQFPEIDIDTWKLF